MYQTANVATYAALFNAACAKLRPAMEKSAALSPGHLLGLGAAGATGLSIPAMYFLMKHNADAKNKATRNTAFGGGVAAGLAAPHIVQGLFNIAQRTGFLPQQPTLPFDPSMLGPPSP